MVTNQVATRSPSVGVGCGAASSRGDARSLSDARPPATSLPRRTSELFGWDALCSVSACLPTCEGLPPVQDMRTATANRVLSWTAGNVVVVESFIPFPDYMTSISRSFGPVTHLVGPVWWRIGPLQFVSLDRKCGQTFETAISVLEIYKALLGHREQLVLNWYLKFGPYDVSSMSVLSLDLVLYTNHTLWRKTRMYKHTVHSCAFMFLYSGLLMTYNWICRCLISNIRSRMSCVWMRTSVHVLLWHFCFVCRHCDGVFT